MARSISNYELIECIIPQASTGTRFFFNDEPQLRFASMKALEVYTPGVVTNSPLSGNALLALADMQKTFLVLYYGDKEAVSRIPVLALNRVATNSGTGNPYVFNLNQFENPRVIWSKSYLVTPTAYATIGSANFSVIFGVHYD
jgi:hypothetical protein